jgi:hypothetical protein
MKTLSDYWRVALGAEVALVLLLSSDLSAVPLKVMPLGDSNTSGTYYARGSYRLRLWQDFGSDITRLEFVGSTGYPLPAELGSKFHEGHSGYTIAASPIGYGNITDKIGFYLNSTRNPDIILMMIGTNDINYNHRVAEAPARLDHLISLISDLSTGLKPTARLIVGSLPPIDDSHNNFRSSPTDYTANARVTAFNAAIPGIVAQHRARGERVYFADLNAKLTVADIFDGLHLTVEGYNKLGDAWYGAITALPEPRQLPQLLAVLMVLGIAVHRGRMGDRLSGPRLISIGNPQTGQPRLGRRRPEVDQVSCGDSLSVCSPHCRNRS